MKLFRKNVSLAASSCRSDDTGGSCVLRGLKHWVVDTGCSVHDAHNALKWGMHQAFEDGELMKDIHIVIESLRNGYDLLHGHLAQWLLEAIKFVEDPTPAEDLVCLWTALGVGAEWLDTLADLGLLFKDGSLEISAKHMSNPSLFETVSSASQNPLFRSLEFFLQNPIFRRVAFLFTKFIFHRVGSLSTKFTFS